MKLSIILVSVILLSLTGYCQDSTRTRNDKPGTPQSLRTPDNAPQNRVHTINTNTAPNQTINHGATESNKVNNTKEQTKIADPNVGNGTVIPQTPVINNSAATHTDSTINKDVINNGKSNVTNPIRK